MKKELIILVGIPCSGKSTWSKKQGDNSKVLSRDNLREKYFGKSYKPTSAGENYITEVFDEELDKALNGFKFDKIILDNTHCKEKYIDSIIKIFGKQCDIKIVFFEVSLFKAHFRNIIRYIKTGKWIPIKVINNMYKNYNKLNKSKYQNLLN